MSFATRWARRLGIGSIILFSTITTVAMRTEATPSRPQAQLMPASGALFGAYVDPDNRWVDNESAEGEVEDFERQIGRKLDIDQHYYGWNNSFPSGLEQWDIANGRTPLITWMGTDLDSINSGQYDDMIAKRARAVASLGQPVFLRWGHEMNGNWYSWSGAANNDSGQTNGPEKFVMAWRHIWRIFNQEGASNVVWVWAVNHESVPNQAWNNWRHFYPGDEYVDWVAIDGYNWGTSRSWSKWTPFSNLFSPVYDDYADRKPVMIAEVGSTEVGGDKGDWIQAAASQIKNDFPAVGAFVWFDVQKEEDWRADSSAGAMQAYRSVANAAYFSGGGSDAGSGDTGSGSGGSGSGGSGSGGSGGSSDDTTQPAVQLSSVAASPDSLVKYTSIEFAVDNAAEVTIRIRDAAGTVVRHRLNHAGYDAGTWAVRWHGKDDRFGRVPNGRYTVVVVAFDANGDHVRATAEVDVV